MKGERQLLNFIASNLNIGSSKKQWILEQSNLMEKAMLILQHMDSDLQLLELKDQIESKVRGDIEKQQRDYFLNQQLRTIQEELGGSPHEQELQEIEERGKSKIWAKNVKDHFFKELNKAKRINPQVAEYSVVLNHLELMLDLPWDEYSKDNFNLANVKKVLDQDHYGLEDVKDRIIEHLAVLKLKGDLKAPIICLVGPPGVGKTSLGKSIATALKRNFIRMSLGGVHDESEIRGHRKTYIGAMAGRIIKSLKKAKASNPVFILDEIDKLGSDHRGDPSSALLEVLDPEQNSSFYDNYLEIEYDLSKVLFIATANSLNSIQAALLDRMEIIEIGGYSTEEKIEIAKKHLLPKQIKEHGLISKDISLTNEALEFIIQKYTRESGVRSLDRMLASVMRNIAKKKAMNEKFEKTPSLEELGEILGIERFDVDMYSKIDTPGIAVGLAWTKVGGDILFIEASTSKGKGKLTLTGNLGEVMKESATTALSFIKAHAQNLDIDEAYFERNDIHIHVPEGAIPKDGPSAGITMLTSITSAIKNKKVKSFLAMTGEITLRGKVLPVGGIKEKVLAAKRAGIKEIMLSSDNKKHVLEINPEFIKDIQFTYVENMIHVLEIAIEGLII
jgi:ATP-dependent Lon protease